MVKQVVDDVVGGGESINQAQDIRRKGGRLQGKPALHQGLRAMIDADVWPTGQRKPTAEGPGEGDGFNAAAFLRTQF